MTLGSQNTQGTQHVQHRYSDRWHFFLRAYARLNRLSRHMLSASIKLVVVLYLLFCLLFLVLRYVLLPNIDNYKTDIEHMIGASLGRSVSISQISASWQGLRPRLELKQVGIRDEQGQNVLMLPNVQATLSWLSLFVADVRLYCLEIDQPELELKRNADGKIYIAGWWIDPDKETDARGLNWILSQRAIVIKNGVVQWKDQLRDAPVLTLSNVNFVMRNRWQRHQFSLTANPPANLAGPLDVRADFKHHPFSENISDFLKWKGLLYANFSKTDLAAWKNYVDYPFEVQQGVGDVRAWYTFDQAKVVDFTADLKLTNVKAWMRKDLQPLDLPGVSGRISVQEIIIPDKIVEANTSVADRLRENGHQIALTNFTFETRSGMRLPPTTLTERFIPAHTNSAEQLQVSTKFLDLNVLVNLMVHFPLPREYSEMLKDVEPAGQLSDFSVKLQGKYPELSRYQVVGKFTNLAMKPQALRFSRISNNQKDSADSLASSFSAALSNTFSTLPGFTNLTGQIDVNEKSGAIQLASKNLRLDLPGYLSESDMKFESINMKATWLSQKNQWLFTLDKLDFMQEDMHAQFHGTHLVPTQLKTPLENKSGKVKAAGVMANVLNGAINLTGTISRFDVQKINRYLPLETDADLRHWLTQGLLQGSLEDVSVRVKGDLRHFPFVKKGLTDQNVFRVTGKIVDGKINYLPGVFGADGVAPYWPLLNKIQGKIVFDRESMDIDAESGETDGVPVAKVHARIPDLFNQKVMLEIDGTANGTAQNMLHYVSASPVLGWIDHFTQDTQISGNTKLKLRLDIPLSHPLDTKVAGEVQLTGNDVALLEELPLMTQVNGRLDFNERGLNLNTMKGNFLGGLVTVVGGTQKDGVIRIKADGQITDVGLRKAYPQPELKNVLARVNGNASYAAIVQVKNKQTEVWMDSTLQGMALSLPAPVSKAASENLHLHFALLNVPANATSGTFERDEINLSLGDMVNARYFRQKESETSQWKIKSGGIGVNVPAPTPDSGVAAHLELASFNVDELQSLLPDAAVKFAAHGATKLINKLINKLDNKVTTKVTTKVVKPDAGDPASKVNLYQYFVPNLLSVHAVELTLMGKKLNQVVLGATRLNGIWQANIDSKQISGYLTWDNADRGLGHVTARLGSLIIPETATNDVVDLLQNEDIHSNIPGLDVIAESVELFGKKLGRLELKAKNANLKNDGKADGKNDGENDGPNEWQIDSLSLSNPDAELTAQGKWMNDGNSEHGKSTGSTNSMKSQTNLNYQLSLINAGKLLDRLGYAHLISGGKGKLNGEISWAGSPYSMDIPSLSGKIQLDLQAGQFLKVEPGAAKLLAVLNLQALPRRLILDFRDVFSNGFSFDRMTGDAEIEKGVVKTDNLKMHSISATVLLSGTANIMNETQDLHVIVVPEVNAGAASVLYGLAVNPLIGAGTFLAQLFLRKPLMKAFTFEYQVTGSWKEPNVVKSDGKEQKTALQQP